MSYRGGPRTLDQRVAYIEEQLRRAQVRIRATVVVTDHGSLDGLSDDDHPQYQLEAEKSQAEGYASLDAGGTVPKVELPADVVYTGDLPDVTDLELLVWMSMGAT